jgi:hypothetical protein
VVGRMDGVLGHVGRGVHVLVVLCEVVHASF